MDTQEIKETQKLWKLLDTITSSNVTISENIRFWSSHNQKWNDLDDRIRNSLANDEEFLTKLRNLVKAYLTKQARSHLEKLAKDAVSEWNEIVQLASEEPIQGE